LPFVPSGSVFDGAFHRIRWVSSCVHAMSCPRTMQTRTRGVHAVGVGSQARVTFIGSGDAFGSGGRLQTCVLVQDGDWRCLLDCGATSLAGLKAAAVEPASIAAIVVSHLHGDHFGGLPFFLLDAQLNSKRAQPLLLVGHSDLEERLRATMELLFPGSQRALELVETRFVEAVPGDAVEIGGGATIEVFDVEHFCGSPPFAVRLTTPSGKIVSYSGDTEWTDALLDVSRDADLFIVETYFYDKRIKWHLDYTTLAANLPRVTARQVIGTHLSADMLDHLDDSRIRTAHDGMTVEVG
jgi:ribonuclease BN (tRNA processing enzyme)